MPRLSGEFILAEDIVPVRYFRKAATESVISSTVLQPDNDIAGIALAASKAYLIQFFGIASGTVGDIKLAWVLTGGAAQLSSRAGLGGSLGMTDVFSTSIMTFPFDVADAAQYGTTSNPSTIVESFLVETTTSSAAGTISLHWAQVTSNSAPSQLLFETFCVVTQVEAG